MPSLLENLRHLLAKNLGFVRIHSDDKTGDLDGRIFIQFAFKNLEIVSSHMIRVSLPCRLNHFPAFLFASKSQEILCQLCPCMGELTIHGQRALLVLCSFGEAVVQRQVFANLMIDYGIELSER